MYHQLLSMSSIKRASREKKQFFLIWIWKRFRAQSGAPHIVIVCAVIWTRSESINGQSKSVFFRPQRLRTNKKTRLCCISQGGDMKDDPPAPFASKGSVLSQVKQPLRIINICANVLYCSETTMPLQSKSGPVHFVKSSACCKSASYVVSVGVENSLSAPNFKPQDLCSHKLLPVCCWFLSGRLIVKVQVYLSSRGLGSGSTWHSALCWEEFCEWQLGGHVRTL